MKKLIFRLLGIFVILGFLFTPALAAPDKQAATPTTEPEPARHFYEIQDKPLFAPGYSAQLIPTEPSLPDMAGYGTWKIVFQSYDNNSHYDINLFDPSTGLKQLTFFQGNNITPSLNVGCTLIAFASNRKGNYDIYLMNIDGSNLQKLTTNKKDDANPDWSPDGTRILFQSYRDGQSEIYVMNSDGSRQTRLTNDPNYDGMPAWSPDGSKIAFISNRSGGYRVYVMNQDGSGLVQLSNQAYSEHPTWSPDGSRIAYDADGNGDGWQEIWYMASDGSNQHKVYQPAGANTDVYVGNWAPDGQYIVYTQVIYTFINNNWYWLEARLYDLDTESFWTFSFTGMPNEWDPYWQTTDGLPAVSNIAPLPANSPASFKVSWSGYDTGPSGFRDFDIDVRDGVAGTWTRWQNATTSTSDTYIGKGGHTYYFRSRGRSNAGIAEQWPVDYDTFTRIESYPPRTSMIPLPAHLRNGSLVSWSGVDVGGSSIQSYDVQTRDGVGGSWVSWLTGTTQTQENFSGTPGHTYSFRVRGTDLAENVENWHADDGEASTTIYTWAASGRILDNVDTPVANVDVSISQNATTHTLSDKEGSYQAFLNETAPGFTMDWQKASYGDLPETELTVQDDATRLTVMPPVDNIVKNWGFEQGSLDAVWQTNGMYPSFINNNTSHTGNNAMQLGEYSKSPLEFISEAWILADPQIAVDHNGIIHLLWLSGERYISDSYYAQRDLDGTWSSPVNVSNSYSAAFQKFAIDDSGVVHIAWLDYDGFHYKSRLNDGTWTAPYKFSDPMPDINNLQVAVSANGDFHVIWEARSGTLTKAYYAGRNSAGNWSTPMNVTNTPGFSQHASMTVDKGGVLHLVWCDYDPDALYYAQKPFDQPWSDPQVLVNHYTDRPKIISDDQSQLHLIYFDDTDESFYYQNRDKNGLWSPADKLSSSAGTTEFGDGDLVVETDGTVHAIWRRHSTIEYSRRTPAGMWDAPIVLDTSYSGKPRLAVDSLGRVNAVWNKSQAENQFSDEIYYSRRDKSGVWTNVENLSNSGENSFQPDIALDKWGQPQIVWVDNIISSMGYLTMGIYHWTPLTVPQTDKVDLSQRLTVPLTMTAPTLSFLYQLEGASTGAGLSVQISNSLTTTQVMAIASDRLDWAHAWTDLSRWSGQTITLTFSVNEIAGHSFVRALIDEVTIGSVHPDVWVSARGVSFAPPGSQVVYQLTYGNRGGLAASGNIISATLPSELEFVSASLTPTITGSTLTWSVGDLSARSGPTTIFITATVGALDTVWHHATLTADITTLGAELEVENNHDQVNTTITWPFYLPFTRKE